MGRRMRGRRSGVCGGYGGYIEIGRASADLNFKIVLDAPERRKTHPEHLVSIGERKMGPINMGYSSVV